MSENNTVTIERPSGTYYAKFSDDGYRKDAAHGCARYGAILAPITEKEDFDAIMKVLVENQDTYWSDFHIGLEIAKDNSSRVFSNGEPYDFEKHGTYIEEDSRPLTSDLCPAAILSPGFSETIYIENTRCDKLWMQFLCFKPKKQSCSAADALFHDNFYSFRVF